MRTLGQEPFELGAIILGAGRSRRMGCPKLLLPWGATSVIGHLVSVWTSLEARQVGIVCSSGDSTLDAELDRRGFPKSNRIINSNPERGMFSSIQCAALWSGWSEKLTHWAIVLGDQPHLRPETLKAILQFARTHPGRVVQPALAGRPKHPVLVPKSVFIEIGRSECSTLKEFLLRRSVLLCELDDPGLALDIDRPEDYRRALEMFGP